MGDMLLGEYMYWTDWQTRKLVRAHKLYPNSSREVIMENAIGLMSIIVAGRQHNITSSKYQCNRFTCHGLKALLNAISIGTFCLVFPIADLFKFHPLHLIFG